MVQQIIFILVAAMTLGSGIIVVTNKNLFHAALAMMLSFAGVAGFYIMLNAGFLAAAQLMVYIGAISILVIFAIMMTRRLMDTNESPFNSQAGFAALGSLALALLFGYIVLDVWSFSPSDSPPYPEAVTQEQALERNWQPINDPETGEFIAAVEIGADGQQIIYPSTATMDDGVEALGRSLVDSEQYVIPFELVSIMLLAALVGSIVIARPTPEEEL